MSESMTLMVEREVELSAGTPDLQEMGGRQATQFDQFSSRVGDAVQYSEWLLDLASRRGWWEVVNEFGIPLTALLTAVLLGVLGIVASLIVGGASVAVAFVAWKTSEKATAIASRAADAERERDGRAERREDGAARASYERRVDEAVERIIDETHEWLSGLDDNTSSLPLYAAVAVAYSRTRGEDRKAIESYQKVVQWALDKEHHQLVHLGSKSVLALAQWRAGALSMDAAIALMEAPVNKAPDKDAASQEEPPPAE